jgi:Fe2+ or Zn2+ uptake regulation protein
MTPSRLDHDAVRDALEAAGLRPTPQRLAVYDQLASMDRHPTAEEVFRAVRPRSPRISLATVYKALEALVAVGAADRLGAESAAGPARYDARGDRHYHFRCLRTGTIHDLPTQYDPRLIEQLDPTLAEDLRRRGFHVTGYRLELLGYQVPGRGRSDAEDATDPAPDPRDGELDA